VSQAGRAASDQAYKGIIDCAVRVFREEGAITFYRGLPPRLVSVVPMMAIQFTVYEYMKRVMTQRLVVNEEAKSTKGLRNQYSMTKL
jgi:Mitochondrial carrier protein